MSYGIYESEINEENEEERVPGFLQLMTFLLIIEV